MHRRTDPDHDAVCESSARHRLIVAPPGTGKTHLSVRLAAHAAEGLPPTSRVLLLTFSNQARAQLEREARAALSSTARRQVEATNYHRFFWRGVSAYRRALKLPEKLRIVTSRQRFAAVAAVDVDLARELADSHLLENLLEHRFPEFRDSRTPPESALATVLDAIQGELRAGRLVFDDLGGLFWTLLEEYPSVAGAYATRYPIVIADEHQDASGLQDALVRRLGREGRYVLADPWQLIHGFRGASAERLDRHSDECDAQFTLKTPHRWHASPRSGRWLLAVRGRLEGCPSDAPPPPGLVVVQTDPKRGAGAVKFETRMAVRNAWNAGIRSIAVLACTNRDVADLRDYLARQGLFPRQLGGGQDLEEACGDIEELPGLSTPQAVAERVLDRVKSLVPTAADQLERARGRLEKDEVKLARSRGLVREILAQVVPIYECGSAYFFEAVSGAVEVCRRRDHHVPRVAALQAIQGTALSSANSGAEVGTLLEQYANEVMTIRHQAPQAATGVFVMTVHQAKGKEFEAIVLAYATDRYFPDDAAGQRLFYVALTRASQRWILVSPKPVLTRLVRHLSP